MPSFPPRMLFQDARPSQGRQLFLSRPIGEPVIADTPEQLPEAFAKLTHLITQGSYVGGYLSYELGYALEPRLLTMLPPNRSGPLLWFSAFGEAKQAFPNETGRAYVGPLHPDWDEDAYRRRFDEVRRLIAAGDIYQANLSFRAHFHFVGDPYALYCRLVSRAGAGYCAYLDTGTRQILSLSPELFFELSSTGVLETRPMKGTAPRGTDAATDAAARLRLGQSVKDRAENLMIVDLLRNDLSRVAELGTVRVENLFQVETYPTLHTLVSTVKAQRKSDTSAEDIIRALFPCGSITGAPKIRAMEILHALEDSPRNAYCGSIGYFAPDGSAQFNVAIRTVTIEGNRGTLGIGGGVVQDSAAESEYAECLLKARYFEVERKPISLIETLRYEPVIGFVRLDRHLARIQNSAQALSLPFSGEAAVEALQKAVRGSRDIQRVRLTLDEAGNLSAAATSFVPSMEGWRYAISSRRVDSADMLSRHKTDWREFYDAERRTCGADEVLFLNEREELVEGSISNIFIRREGLLLTSPLSSGALAGVLRQELLDEGRCREQVLTAADLYGEVFFGNSLRGLIPGRLDTRRQCAE